MDKLSFFGEAGRNAPPPPGPSRSGSPRRRGMERKNKEKRKKRIIKPGKARIPKIFRKFVKINSGHPPESAQRQTKTMNESEDEKIWEKLRQRDEETVTRLFKAYYERLYLFAEKFIYDSDKAHDIVQDVFVRMWENAERLKGKLPVRSYLFAAVRNGCINHLRDLKIEDRNNRKYAEACVDSYNMDLLEDEDALEKVRKVMEELPEKCREVARLRMVEGYKYAEIAAALGMKENTVKAHLHRALARFKEVLGNCDSVMIGLLLWQFFDKGL